MKSHEVLKSAFEKSGYFVKENDHDTSQAFDVLPATNEILHQFSAMLLEISRAAQDNSITPDEASDIRQCWNKLKGYTEGFVKACEDGDFELIKKTTVAPAPESDKPRTKLY